jgi:hypothetical protein
VKHICTDTRELFVWNSELDGTGFVQGCPSGRRPVDNRDLKFDRVPGFRTTEELNRKVRKRHREARKAKPRKEILVKDQAGR